MRLSGPSPEAAASVDALLRHVVESTQSLPSACGEYVMGCLDDSGFQAVRATGGNRGPSGARVCIDHTSRQHGPSSGVAAGR